MSSALDWFERGRDLGATLDSCHAVVVAGGDLDATAEVALGIARRQAERRRVAIADLIGDVPPLHALVGPDDTHGIVDSFVFGVSLNKVAHAVAGEANLFVIPSGSAPLEHEELFTNPRWGRLTLGFREVGALLVLVAPYDATRLRDLVDRTDGLVIVGDQAPADVPVAQALAWLRPRRASAAAPQEAPLAVVTSAKAEPRRRRWLAPALGVAMTLFLAAVMFWFARRPFAGQRPERRVSELRPTAASTAPILRDSITAAAAAALRADSIGSESLSVAAALAGLVVANPADSEQAARWSVRLEQTATRSAAIMDLRGRFETLPAGTYGIDIGTRYLLLVAGAYTSRAGADSLLVQLHEHRILPLDNGSVVSLPYAFLVQRDVSRAEVPVLLRQYAARGHVVYALRQANDSANLYYGAYESREQAMLSVTGVRDAGVQPLLVYRTGRVF